MVHQEIAEAVGEYDSAQVVSGDFYRAAFLRLEQLQDQYVEDTVITADGKKLTQISTGSTLYVSSKINLSLPDSIIINDEKYTSVLLNAAGSVLFKSLHNIAFRVAMFQLKDGSDAGIAHDRAIIRSTGDKLIGPMTGSVVGYSYYDGWRAPVGPSGRYSIQTRIPPCPGFSYTMHSFVYVDLYYLSFNPRKDQPMVSWGLMQNTSDTCTGYGASGISNGIDSLNAVVADSILFNSAANVDYNHNFIVDLLLITSDGSRLYSLDGTDIPLSDSTTYALNPSNYTPINYNVLDTTANLDLDGDGVTDTQVAIKDVNGDTVQIAVYLNDRPAELDPDTGEPINYDLLRQPDHQASQQNSDGGDIPLALQHQGLLSQISEADLLDTDILTYRASNDERISERGKLSPNALDSVNDSRLFGAGLNPDGSLYFNTPVLWTNLSAYLGERLFASPETRRPEREYSDAVNLVDENRYPNVWRDQLRPGEMIDTYLINRSSGYIGKSRTQIESNSGQALLGTFSPPAALLPPNLKIRVERRHKVQSGITQGEERNQLVGFEGSGLTTDTMLVITTEWYDQDGSPLPKDLPGYTARLAKVVSNKQLQAVGQLTEQNENNDTIEKTGNQVAHFSIEPGTHTKTIFIPTDNRPEHFYLHVSGQPITGQADFSPSGQAGILGERPAKYVPFKVAVYDEAKTLADKAAARADDALDVEDVKPTYNWVYRPEMQFSVFDFEMKNIHRDGENGENFNYIIDLSNPVIGSGDTIDILYSLLEPEFDALTQLGTDRELILAIGEYEIALQAGENQTQILFAELEHFDLLNPEDYLTISLYQNSDSANVLWEFAFRTLDADVDSDNNNGLERPDRSTAEERIESDIGQPGKILSVNTDDTDNDGVPNFADFDAGVRFAQFIIEVPNSVDRTTATITFTYSASSPSAVTQQTNNGITEYIPDVGHLRLWLRNGDQVRDSNSLTDSGDYLQSGQAYPLNMFVINCSGQVQPDAFFRDFS